jgi:hypothetical protein
LKLLNVLVTLRAGVEAESSRSELEAALGKTGTIAGVARAITSVEVSEEGAAATLTRLSKVARGTGSPLLAASVPGRRPTSHHGDRNTANGGALPFPLPMKP